jgi:hypothetical protein
MVGVPRERCRVRKANAALCPPFAVERAILNRLGDVRRADRFDTGEIGDGARNLEDAGIGTRREAELRHGAFDERGAGRVGTGECVEFLREHLGIATGSAEARMLTFAGDGDARRRDDG